MLTLRSTHSTILRGSVIHYLAYIRCFPKTQLVHVSKLSNWLSHDDIRLVSLNREVASQAITALNSMSKVGGEAMNALYIQICLL